MAQPYYSLLVAWDFREKFGGFEKMLVLAALFPDERAMDKLTHLRRGN
ncbi:hypothetical protein [Marivita hallyeonensis]|nr:hypothetical protein [Marivita hallyeonensis]